MEEVRDFLGFVSFAVFGVVVGLYYILYYGIYCGIYKTELFHPKFRQLYKGHAAFSHGVILIIIGFVALGGAVFLAAIAMRHARQHPHVLPTIEEYVRGLLGM